MRNEEKTNVVLCVGVCVRPPNISQFKNVVICVGVCVRPRNISQLKNDDICNFLLFHIGLCVLSLMMRGQIKENISLQKQRYPPPSSSIAATFPCLYNCTVLWVQGSYTDRKLQQTKHFLYGYIFFGSD